MAAFGRSVHNGCIVSTCQAGCIGRDMSLCSRAFVTRSTYMAHSLGRVGMLVTKGTLVAETWMPVLRMACIVRQHSPPP